MRLASVLLVFAVIAPLAPMAASADDGNVTSGPTAFVASWGDETPASSAPAAHASGNSIVDTIEEVTCAMGGDQTCAEPALCDNGDVMVMTTWIMASGELMDAGNNCPQDAVAAAPPQVTPGLVLQALRRIDLPASDLNVQPPGGRTLVNFETNFFTENGAFTRTVRLLGQRVELRIWPASFGWRFGDGSATTTSDPGSPYPHLDITHRYLDKGRVSPSVDTTYAARFRVGGGPWRDVNGTVTIPGSPEGLRVVTARPVLVGD